MWSKHDSSLDNTVH